MKKKITFVFTLFISSVAIFAQTSNIYVDLGTRGNDVEESMYGIFFEEINHAGDGGLYAELIQNRGFEEHVNPGGMTYNADEKRMYAPHSLNYYGLDYVDSWVDWNMEEKKMQGWTISKTNCSVASEVETPDVPLHENTPNALHLTITNSTDQGQVDIINSGYWGVPTVENATYTLRFYLKSSSYSGEIDALITDANGTILAQTQFEAQADNEWREYKATLTADKTVSQGDFRLRLFGDGELDIDYVSLFPTNTYKGRENGLRRDIAETLEALHPKFMRWPGGCIVEGITLENRVKWKETIGDPMTRRGEYSLWGYRSTYGLGYYEFLQFCEDVGMDGMFVANVGLSCCLRNGDYIDANDTESLTPYLQDIRDAIEYAIGDPATNEWAALRAEHGHPDPFPLKYIELGNENGTQRYADRWEFFYNTLKSEYPDLLFITSLTYYEADMINGNVDLADTHWYVTPDEFYADATLFDDVERGTYKVYAGEYAANNDVGSGNMDAALSEAVFIGGMERNSDYVTMASYAPLLTNVNQPNWSCNLIWFDTDDVMGRASYYVQKLYAENKPSYNVKTRLYSDSVSLISSGRIGIGTWNTQAEFRNLRVKSLDEQEVYYTADFAAKPDYWTEDGGTWEITSDNTWKQSANGTPCMNFLNAWNFRNCVIEVEACKLSGAEGFFVAFGCDDDNVKNYWRINIGGWGNTANAFEKVTDGSGTTQGETSAFTIKTGQWYTVKLELREGEAMRCYIDGELTNELQTGDLFNGRLQAFGGYDSDNGQIVLKVVNAKEEEMTSDVVINANNIQSTGQVITLSSNSLSDENSLENPTLISPIEENFDGFSTNFSYTFKPNSLTIFRINADSDIDKTLEIPTYNWDSAPRFNNEAEETNAYLHSYLKELIAKANSIRVKGTTGIDTYDNAITIAYNVAYSENSTIKEMNDQIDALNNAITEYVKGIQIEDNNYTSLIENANFSTMSTTGWKGSEPSLEYNVGEFFNTTFNTYQDLSNLVEGKYLYSVQAFYREGLHDNAYANHTNGTESLNTYMYAGDSLCAIRSIYDYTFDVGSWNNYLDNRYQTEQAFNSGDDIYANYLIADVKEDGALRIGLKKTVSVALDWCCFNNFQLYYIPVEMDGIETIESIDEAPDNIIYDISGRKVSNPKHGLYIQKGKKIIIL